jgi:hypothetical protein
VWKSNGVWRCKGTVEGKGKGISADGSGENIVTNSASMGMLMKNEIVTVKEGAQFLRK